MKRIAISLTAASLIAVASAVGITGSEPDPKPMTMLSRLNVGRAVRLQTGKTGGFNVDLLNEQALKSLERNFQKSNPTRKYVPSKITEVGTDYIVVLTPAGAEQTIAAHAIDVITKLPVVKVELEDEPKK
jgi:hypothetical protein